MEHISYSSISLFANCPYHFRLRYHDMLPVMPDYKSDNPLVLGTALHTCIERGVDEGIRWYKSQFPILTDEIETEAWKLSIIGQKAYDYIHRYASSMGSEPIFEKRIEVNGFLGFADCLIELPDGTYHLFDFKYSSSPDRYADSSQIAIYKYFLDEAYGIKVSRMTYLVCQKVSFKRDFDMTEEDYRLKLKPYLMDSEPVSVSISMYQYPLMISSFMADLLELKSASSFVKYKGKLCWWCEYREYCENGLDINLSYFKEDYMELPKNERISIGSDGHWRLWLYGQSYTGKTYLTDKFPDVLMLNSDGNTTEVSAPRIRIANQYTTVGNTMKTTLAWDYFKDVITELAKGQNTYKTIVVDLVEDFYEFARYHVYESLGIEHESENSFKAWDMVRTEFFSTMRKLMALPYNFILISQEDTSRDITMKSGDKITAIKPNINDKVATKLAGMVTLTGRVLKTADNNRIISFKTDDVVFGGGRIELKASSIPCTYEALIGILEGNEVPKSESVLTEETPPKRRRRKAEAPEEENAVTAEESAEESAEDNPPIESMTAEHPVTEPFDAESEQKDEAPVRRRRRRVVTE